MALAVFLWAFVLGSTASAAEPPRVVVSIKPIHALVAGVMQGVSEPKLLIGNGASPHTYSLKPSDARNLQDADVIFRVGRALETFLEKPLASVPRKARVIDLVNADGVMLLDYRESASVSGAPHSHRELAPASTAANEQGDHVTADMHIWLDIDNARALVSAIVTALAEADPERAEAYRSNADRTQARLRNLDQELHAKLAPVAGRPYIVFHDAYRYLERRYGLHQVGSITVSPERQPSAQHILELRSLIVASGAACLFGEPQFAPALLRTLTEGTSARLGVLDAEGGIGVAPGPDAYFTIMRDLGNALEACLDPAATR